MTKQFYSESGLSTVLGNKKEASSSFIGEIRQFSSKTNHILTDTGEEWLQTGYVKRDITGYPEAALDFYFDYEAINAMDTIATIGVPASSNGGVYSRMFIFEDTLSDHYIWMGGKNLTGWDVYSKSGVKVATNLKSRIPKPYGSSVVTYIDGYFYVVTGSADGAVNNHYLISKIKLDNTTNAVISSEVLTFPFYAASVMLKGIFKIDGELLAIFGASNAAYLFKYDINVGKVNEFLDTRGQIIISTAAANSDSFSVREDGVIISTYHDTSNDRLYSGVYGFKYKYRPVDLNTVVIKANTGGSKYLSTCIDKKTNELFMYRGDNTILYSSNLDAGLCVGSPITHKTGDTLYSQLFMRIK